MNYFLHLSTALIMLSCGDYEEIQRHENTQEQEQVLIEETPAMESILKVADVNADAFKDLLSKEEGMLIDVRTPEEFGAGHIDGAINIDFRSATFSENIDTLDKSVPVFVYFQAGGRSGQARDMMAEQGFTTIYNLLGGYGSWNH